jgi:hypothetical protein
MPVDLSGGRGESVLAVAPGESRARTRSVRVLLALVELAAGER